MTSPKEQEQAHRIMREEATLEKAKEIKFPLNFTICPNCGSTRRIANEVLEQEKKKGKAGPGIIAFLFQNQSTIVDTTRTVLSAPVIASFYDACADCGAVYLFHTELYTAVSGMK